MSHPVATMQRAHELAEAGWGYRKIRSLLESEGFAPPGDSTIKRWLDPSYAERQARKHRERQAELRAASSDYRWPSRRGPLWRLNRMRVLDRAGLSAASIAKVMSTDFPGEPITEHQATYALRTGAVPSPYREAA